MHDLEVLILVLLVFAVCLWRDGSHHGLQFPDAVEV